MIRNIRVSDAGKTCSRRGGERGGGELHGPEHHSGRSEVGTAGVHDAEDFSTVQGEVARVHRHAKPRNAGEAAGAGHVVEASAGVEVMAAAGASANRCAAAMTAVGENVAADTDDQRLRTHRDLRKVIRQNRVEGGNFVSKRDPSCYEGNRIFPEMGTTPHIPKEGICGPTGGRECLRNGDFTTTIRDVRRNQWPDFRETKRIERFTDNSVRSTASTIQPDSANKDDLMAASSRV